MDALGLEQHLASNIMIGLGAAETFIRLFSSFVGDHLKGWVLPIYTGLCIGLCLVNIMGIYATNAVHITLYVIGQCSLHLYISFGGQLI